MAYAHHTEDACPPGLSLTDLIDVRLAALQEWLQQNAPEIDGEQKHLDAESAERAYWHFGYASALRDIQKCLPGRADPIS